MSICMNQPEKGRTNFQGILYRGVLIKFVSTFIFGENATTIMCTSYTDLHVFLIAKVSKWRNLQDCLDYHG
jgi:hypothetical protein